MKLAQLREKEFIHAVLSRFATTARADRFEDCVVIDPAALRGRFDDPVIVYSVDHPSKIKRPLPPGLEWRFYGRWIAGCTAGDVLAMGAQPLGFALDFAVPLDTSVEVVEEIYRGIADVLALYGAEMEGGNVDVSQRLETVGVCWGAVERSRLVRRSGARPGDWIAVTTELGLGWASYLLSSAGRFDALSDGARAFLTGYNAMPVAPHRAMLAAAAIPGAITSGMDLTDGVCEFLHVIAERNDVGVRLCTDWLPAHPVLEEAATLLGALPVHLALDPGYDTPRVHGYTVARDRWDEVAATFVEHGAVLHKIGEVTSGRELAIEMSGRLQPLPKFVDDQFEKDGVVARWREQIGQLR